MSSFGLNDFKSYFNGGTRSNRFEIWANPLADHVHIRSASIPEATSKSIAFDHFGRKHYYPGEKQYGSWAFTVIDDDPDFVPSNVWEEFQNWQNLINDHPTNTYDYDATGFGSYKQDVNIYQFDFNGETAIKTYVLKGAWPQRIEPISFNMTRPNELNYFNIVMVYDSVEIYNDSSAITRE